MGHYRDTQIMSKALTQNGIQPCFSSEIKLTLTPHDLPNSSELISAILPRPLSPPKHTFEQATVLQCPPCWSVNISSQGQAVFRTRHTRGTRAIGVYIAACLHHLRTVFYSWFRRYLPPYQIRGSSSTSMSLLPYYLNV